MTRTAFGRKRKHGNARLSAEQGPARVGRGDSDLRQFSSARFNHHAAIGKDHGAVVTETLIAQRHQEKTGHQLEARPYADAMQSRAHSMRSRIRSARY